MARSAINVRRDRRAVRKSAMGGGCVKTRRPILETGDRSTYGCRTGRSRVFYWRKSRLVPKSRAAGESNSLHPLQSDVFTRPWWRADIRSAGVSNRVITDRRLFLLRNSRMMQHGFAAADVERLCIGHDASGGSAFGILRQSIIKRQPCLLAGSPDVFSGLEIFWHIQAAARQADHTGARPLGEQRSPADCAEASNKNWGRIATSQRTGHRNSIQGH